jgi:hypothetical protein
MTPSDDQTPGLKVRRNRDGSERLYWVARADLVAKGYEPETVRLHYDRSTAEGKALISAACLKFQAEMMEWVHNQTATIRTFDGTIAALVRNYQRDKASPYQELKWNTRRTYDQVLGVIERAFGKKTLGSLRIGDFREWYDEAKKPAEPGAPERVRKAHGIIAMLRRLFSYGITAELPECQRLALILDNARFKQPARRRKKLEFEHASAIVDKAIELGRLTIALGQALQFDTAMRQRDVIGEWIPLKDGERPSGIMLGRRRWGGGLLWSDILASMKLHKETTKTGSIVSHDLSLCPLVMKVLALIPADQRVGPVIIDEQTPERRPFAEHAFTREWRIIATAAGVPSDIWNMDTRAGAITEAEDAGAELDTIRGAVGHSQASTTARYSRGAIGKSQTVANLRAAHRKTKNGE